MSIYFYKLTVDSGGAPCTQNGLLSLAICKPMIRKKAKPDDLIFGFAANSLHRDNRLIYIARITERLCRGKYYVDPEFANRGDCIYEQCEGKFAWRQNALHHSSDDLEHDLGRHPEYSRANVLLSTDFRYFGKDGTADYKSRYLRVKKAVEKLGQGSRVKHEQKLRDELINLKEEIWKHTHKMVIGTLSSAPRRSACHRSKSCGIL